MMKKKKTIQSSLDKFFRPKPSTSKATKPQPSTSKDEPQPSTSKRADPQLSISTFFDYSEIFDNSQALM